MFIITNSKIVFTKFSKKASQSSVGNGNNHFLFLRKFFSSLFSHGKRTMAINQAALKEEKRN